MGKIEVSIQTVAFYAVEKKKLGLDLSIGRESGSYLKEKGLCGILDTSWRVYEILILQLTSHRILTFFESCHMQKMKSHDRVIHESGHFI